VTDTNLGGRRSIALSFALGGGILTLALACGSSEPSSGSGGTTGSGGTASGGTSAGGAPNSSGGASSGSGGSDLGGAASGGNGSVEMGFAQLYPGDVGIDNEPSVIFADDFESYAEASDLWDRWDNTFQEAHTRIAMESANVFFGEQALEFTLPASTEEVSNAVQKVLTEELDVLYLRWYSKFDVSNDIVGSSHNGGGISAHYFVDDQATPGVPADGTNKFLMEFEHWRGEATTPAPGELNVYIYHPEQRDDYGDHFFPSGKVLPNTSIPFDFGDSFVSRPDLVPELDRWYCYELMVRANTAGERDGRVTIWLDGVRVGDFGNLRLRDVDTLKIDRFNLSFHARESPTSTKRFYDNVVAATAYIGPMTP